MYGLTWYYTNHYHLTSSDKHVHHTSTHSLLPHHLQVDMTVYWFTSLSLLDIFDQVTQMLRQADSPMFQSEECKVSASGSLTLPPLQLLPLAYPLCLTLQSVTGYVAETSDWSGKRSEGCGLCIQFQDELYDAVWLAVSQLLLCSTERYWTMVSWASSHHSSSQVDVWTCPKQVYHDNMTLTYNR